MILYTPWFRSERSNPWGLSLYNGCQLSHFPTLHSIMLAASLLLYLVLSPCRPCQLVTISRCGAWSTCGLPVCMSTTGLQSMEAFLQMPTAKPMVQVFDHLNNASHLNNGEQSFQGALSSMYTGSALCFAQHFSLCRGQCPGMVSPACSHWQTCSPERPFLALPRFLSWGWQRSSACLAPQHSGQRCQQAASGPGRHCCSLSVHTCT